MNRLGFMGKNLPAKKHTIGNPTHLKLRYMLDHTASAIAGNNDSHFIDLAEGLSMVNRRMYRSGLYYHVSSVTVHDSNQNVWVKFATAPDTWYTKQAWIRGFRAWSRMNSEAAKGSGTDDLSLAGKYHDYKVFLSQTHRSQFQNGRTDCPIPVGAVDYGGFEIQNGFITYSLAAAEFPAGEFDYSVMRTQDPPTDPTDITLTGHHTKDNNLYDSYSLTKGYFETKNKQSQESPESDNLTDIDYIANLFDAGDQADDILNDLENDNDTPPYDWDNYPLQTVLVAQTANSAGAGAVTRTGGFTVPFGLLEVITNAQTSGKVEIVIELTAGTYNGVAAARAC